MAKKATKNQARLPRTAGLRTLTELTTELTKAGLDPSRIQERAAILAKLQGEKRKREREEDVEMDDGVDEDGDEGLDWMDVDGEEAPPLKKRVKGNSGAVVATDRRGPKTDRRVAGMRDQAVCRFVFCVVEDGMNKVLGFVFSKRVVLSSFAILGKDLAICWRRLEREIVISRQKWFVIDIVSRSGNEC